MRCQFDTKKGCIQLILYAAQRVNPCAMVLLFRQNCVNFRSPMILVDKPGRILNLFILLFLATVLLSNTPLHAQKGKKGFKKGGTIALNDSLTTYSQSDIFVFPNVNKVGFYYDAAKLKKDTRAGCKRR